MSLKRHVLQVVALVTAVALVFGAFAGSAGAKKMTKGQKAKVRKQLRKQVKKNPGAVKRKSFLRAQRLSTSSFRSPFVCATRARRERSEPDGRSAVAGRRAADDAELPDAGHGAEPAHDPVGERQPRSVARYAFGRHRWRAGRRRRVPGHLRRWRPGQRQPEDPPGQQDADDLVGAAALEQGHHRTPARVPTRTSRSRSCVPGAAARGDSRCTAASADGDCSRAAATGTPPSAALRAHRHGIVRGRSTLGAPVGYKALFYDVAGRTSRFRHVQRCWRPGLHGVHTLVARRTACSCRSTPASTTRTNIQAGGVIGDNDWIGTNPNPFPTGSLRPLGHRAPTTYGGRLRQRGGHRAAHQRSVPGHRPGRRVGQHEHRYRDDSGWSDDRSGLAGRHARLLRWPGEPVREHPGQERRHRRDREPRDEDQLDRADHGPGCVQAARRSSRARSTRPASSTAVRSSRALCRTTSRVSV